MMPDPYTEARAALAELSPGDEGVYMSVSTVRALLDASRPQEVPAQHDEKCEAEYVAEAPGWTECDCDSRAQEVPDDALEVLTARAEADLADAIVEWQAKQPVTDAQIEAAGSVLYANWEEFDFSSFDMDRGIRELVRAALEAARQEGNHT